MNKYFIKSLGNIMTSFDGEFVTYRPSTGYSYLMKKVNHGPELDQFNFNRDMNKALKKEYDQNQTPQSR